MEEHSVSMEHRQLTRQLGGKGKPRQLVHSIFYKPLALPIAVNPQPLTCAACLAHLDLLALNSPPLDVIALSPFFCSSSRRYLPPYSSYSPYCRLCPLFTSFHSAPHSHILLLIILLPRYSSFIKLFYFTFYQLAPILLTTALSPPSFPSLESYLHPPPSPCSIPPTSYTA